MKNYVCVGGEGGGGKRKTEALKAVISPGPRSHVFLI